MSELAARLGDFNRKAERLLHGADKMSTPGIAIGLSMLITLNLELLRECERALTNARPIP